MITAKIKMLMITGLLAVFAGAPLAFAMTSANYSLNGDFNNGGGRRSSSSYVMSLDAIGGGGGSASTSAQYALWGGGVSAATDSYVPFGAIILDNGTPLTKHTLVNVHLEATDNNGVIGYYLSENSTKPGVSDAGWTAVTSTLSLVSNTTFTVSAEDGAKTVYAWFKDRAGNVSRSAQASIILDNAGTVFSTTEVPGMVISALPDGSHTTDATLNVTGIVADLSVQAVLVGSDPVLINPDGSFSVAVTLVPGANVIQITIIDQAGNQSTVTRTITLDPAAPALAVTSPADGIMTARNYIDIAGSADPNAVVTIADNQGDQITPGRSGVAFSATVNLDAGLNTITIFASLNGATQTAKRTVFYNFKKPGLSVTRPEKDVTITSGTVTIAGVVSDALTDVIVKVTADGVDHLPSVVSNSTFTQDVTFAKEGVYPVIVTATDEDGNSSSVQRNVQYQRGYIVIKQGAAATTSPTVSLDLSYSAPAGTVSTMQFLYNNTAWTAPMTFASKKNITLPLGDGVKTVFVRYTDSTGAQSAIYSDTVILDTRAPLGSLTINDGAAVTTSATVTLGLTVSDANGVIKMQFSDNGTTWGASEPFAAKRAYPLPGAYGTKKVYARFIDAAGKVSAAASDTITYAASATVSDGEYVVIKNGDAYTTTATVPVAITNPDPAYTQMRVSTNGTTWLAWETMKTSKSVTLPAGDGVKTVYVQCKKADNTLSSTYSDSIILDTVAPKGTIQIDDGAYSTKNHDVTLTLTASDLNGVLSMQTSTNNLDWATRTWEPFTGTKAITLPAGEGAKTVWVKYKDNAGKISAACSDTILVDTVAPIGKVLINAGTKVITSRNVTLSFTATKATYLKLSLDNGARWGDWEPYAASKKVTLPAGDGTKIVQAYFRDLTGNESPTPAISNSVSYSQTQAPSSITVPASSPVVNYLVSWGASPTAGVTTGVTYVLQEATSADFIKGLRTAYSGLGLSVNITSRLKGLTYYYRVQAKKTGYESSPQTIGNSGCMVGP